jgi:hypothetical protein
MDVLLSFMFLSAERRRIVDAGVMWVHLVPVGFPLPPLREDTFVSGSRAAYGAWRVVVCVFVVPALENGGGKKGGSIVYRL